MIAENIIGDIAEEVFAGRRRHHVDIGWGDATKHRQVVTADTGLVVHIALPAINLALFKLAMMIRLARAGTREIC